MWLEGQEEGGREGEGGVGDAGFVLPVAKVKNSSNTTNTTSQSVRWPPWLQPKIHPIVRVAKHASLLSVSMLVYISALSIPSLHPSPSFPSNLAGLVVVACSINTEVQGIGKKRVGQNELEVVSLSSLFCRVCVKHSLAGRIVRAQNAVQPHSHGEGPCVPHYPDLAQLAGIGRCSHC